MKQIKISEKYCRNIHQGIALSKVVHKYLFKNQKVVVNFENVEESSYAFFQGFLGSLFMEFDYEKINNCVIMNNLNSSDHELVSSITKKITNPV